MKLPTGRTLQRPFYFEPLKDRTIKIPSSLYSHYRDYQRDGAVFFYERYKQGRGGLLGDDMGLGKTLQVIGFLSGIMRKLGDERDMGRRHKHVSKLQDGEMWKKHKKLPPANQTWPTALIIAPSSVVGNWQREFQKVMQYYVSWYEFNPLTLVSVGLLRHWCISWKWKAGYSQGLPYGATRRL